MNILKVEIRRAFTNRKFIIALMIGIGISMVHITLNIPDVIDKINMAKIYPKENIYVTSSYAVWIGGNTYTAEVYLYYLILPILATLPFGSSFFDDKKSGVTKNIILKSGKGNYFVAKYVATFLSGGFVVVFPLLLNLLVTMMFVPTILPEATAGIFSISGMTMCAELFYDKPLLYIMMYFVIDFIAAGFIATIALVMSFYTEYRFVVELMPMFIYVFIFSLFSLLSREYMQPDNFLIPSFPHSDGVVIFTEIFVLAIITIIFWSVKGKRYESL